MTTSARLLFALAALLAGAAIGAEPEEKQAPDEENAPLPSAAEIGSVLGWFESGKGRGPVVLELTPCLTIERQGAAKQKSCAKPITGSVGRNTTAWVFMRFAVPRDDRYELRVEWLHEGEVRAQAPFTVSTSWSYATWKAQQLDKSGRWEARISRGTTTLASVPILVE